MGLISSAPAPPRQAPNSFSPIFASYVEEKTRGFVGRKHVFTRVQEPLTKSKRGYPGTMKSGGDWCPLTTEGNPMKQFVIIMSLMLGSYSLAEAQGAAGSSGGSASGSTSSSGAGSATGNTLSNASTINGTGGSPGPNTSNALNHGTTGNNLGAPQTNSSDGTSASPAVNTPAANSAVNSLSNTDTGVLKK
jgi:hypothetical protein